MLAAERLQRMASKHPPNSRLLMSTARREVSFENNLYELIDNAIDAGAKRIKITCASGKQSYLRIEDDGQGCADLDKMRVIGEHDDQDGIGHWGIGGTESYIQIGGVDSTCTIASTRGGVTRRSTVQWRAVADSDWGYPDIVESEDPTAESGTTIVVAPLVKRARSWEDLANQIGKRYWPAMRRVHIELRTPRQKQHAMVGGPRFPVTLPGGIDTTVAFGNYQARVQCGIVPEDQPNPMPGFTYYCFPRVIKIASSDGAGDHSVSQIFGRVELIKGWRRGGLSALKQEFEADEQLYTAVLKVCEPLLKKADLMGQSVELAKFNEKVGDLVNSMLGRPESKGRRLPGDKRGTKDPTGKGGEHTKAENEQPGDRFPTRKAGSIRIAHRPLGTQEAGRVTGREIILNTDKSLIGTAFREGMHVVSTVIALNLWNEYVSINPPRGKRRATEKFAPLPMGDPQSVTMLSERLGALLDAFSAANIEAKGAA